MISPLYCYCQVSQQTTVKRSLRMNSPELMYMIVGALGAMVHGINNAFYNFYTTLIFEVL